MDGYRTAQIYVDDRLAGLLKETEGGYSFEYDNDYVSSPEALPVSLTLPLRRNPYTSEVLFSFFDGLIPEGWLLDVVVHNWKLDPRDRFGLLLVSCADPIGNVYVREADE